MESEIKETDQRLNDIIKKNNGKEYTGTSYINAEMDELVGKPDEEKDLTTGEEEDIFNDYGFGIISWFSLLKRLI